MIDLLQHYLLSVLIFLPTAGATAVLIVRHRVAVRWIALGVTLVDALLSLLLAVPAVYEWRISGAYACGDAGGVVQLVQRADWIASLHAQYLLGLDGLSLPLVILTCILFSMACVAAWKVDRPTGFFALLLMLETAILGAYLSLDFLLFFVFAQMSLLPIFFLFGWWGASRRASAGTKFVLPALCGSIALLVVLIQSHLHSRGLAPPGTFDLIQLADPRWRYPTGWIAGGLFLLSLLAFFVRLPVIPFHYWAEETYANAPAPVGMILAGAMASIGGYGLYRVAWALFPQTAAHLRPLIVLIALLSILYGALCALSQDNLKRLVADLCICQMGFVLLGTATGSASGVSGAIFMMAAWSLVAASLLAVAGILEDRAGHCDIARLGGIAGEMPVFTGLSLVPFFASLGLPGLGLFVGQFLVIIGTFSAGKTGYWAHLGWRSTAVLACGAIFLTAAAALGAFGKIFFGQARQPRDPMPDLDQRELALFIPLSVCIVLLGVFPWILLLCLTQQTVAAMIRSFF